MIDTKCQMRPTDTQFKKMIVNINKSENLLAKRGRYYLVRSYQRDVVSLIAYVRELELKLSIQPYYHAYESHDR